MIPCSWPWRLLERQAPLFARWPWGGGHGQGYEHPLLSSLPLTLSLSPRLFFLPRSSSPSSLSSRRTIHHTRSIQSRPIPTRVACSIQRAYYLHFHLTHIGGGRNREEEEPKLSFRCTWTVETAKYLAERFASARSKRKPHQLLPFLLLLLLLALYVPRLDRDKGDGAARPWIQRCTNFWPSCTPSRNGIRSTITSWK